MDDALEERLRTALARGPKIGLAILFGSHARGVARPNSDVDLAILPGREGLSDADESALATELERAARAPVDLVRIDGAKGALVWRIARDGVVLVSDPPSLASRFLARAGIEHDDVREIEADAMRRYRARLAEGEAGPPRTDVGLVLHKLSRLKEQVALVRARRPAAPEGLAKDLTLRDAMALAFLIAAQEAIDVAYYVAADEAWGVPDSHAAAFDLLAQHGVIDAALAGALSGAARVRNRIAHGYASVDHARLWRELPDGLDALDAFAAAVARWVPEETPG